MEYHKLNALYEVLEIISNKFNEFELEKEEVGIENAYGRFLAENIIVNNDIPGFDRAAVDGFALISKNTLYKKDGIVGVFKQIGQSEVGKECILTIDNFECVYVSEGAMIPKNADAVVSLNDCEIAGPYEVVVNDPIEKYQNVIRKGEDIRAGACLLNKGDRIKAKEIGALAGAGINHIKVFRRLNASVISAGEEFVEHFSNILYPGKVRDINSFTTCALLKEMGVVATNKGIHKDYSKDIENVLEKSLEVSDIIIISGGTSSGTMDKTLNLIKRIEEVEILADNIAMNPGKDTIVAKLGDKVVLGLPGKPTSIFITMQLLVKNLVSILNKSQSKVITIKAICTDNYKSLPGREEYLLINLDKNEHEYLAAPIIGKGLITQILHADGYTKIRPSDGGVIKGQEIEVVLF